MPTQETLNKYVETFKAYSQANKETQEKARPMIEKALEEYNNLKIQQLTPQPQQEAIEEKTEQTSTYNWWGQRRRIVLNK